MSEKKGKVIETGFKNESIQSCINIDEIFKSLENPNIKENLEKCLNSSPKLFTH
ncbi:MAG: hypothetical protein ACXABG_08160 [Promethearchaeota archaeon]|jgi:hypothetical protein